MLNRKKRKRDLKEMVGMEGNCRKVKGWEVTEMQIMMSGKVQAKSKKKYYISSYFGV